MLQEDSNGEASFEIIDKKHEDSSNNDKTESISSVSSPYSIPSPGVGTLPGGNLLSNLPPPTNLPDFTLVPAPTPLPPSLLPATTQETKPAPPVAVSVQPFPRTQFSAAIPPSKGLQHGPVPQSSLDTNQGTGGGLIGWMKDAVSSGGILSKVAEKAKNSVDTLITTLDPQMSEFICVACKHNYDLLNLKNPHPLILINGCGLSMDTDLSRTLTDTGGDVEISVASQDPEEISPIREAIFSVFGKAWVNGVNIKIDERKHQAVGFEDGVKRAEEKLKAALQINKLPTVAVENILLQQEDQWFDLSVILLRDSEKQISLKTYTQTTPIPDSFLKQAEKELPVYAKGCDSVEKLLAAYLQVSKNSWQQGVSGVARKETIFLATRALLTLYKNMIIN